MTIKQIVKKFNRQHKQNLIVGIERESFQEQEERQQAEAEAEKADWEQSRDLQESVL